MCVCVILLVILGVLIAVVTICLNVALLYLLVRKVSHDIMIGFVKQLNTSH